MSKPASPWAALLKQDLPQQLRQVPPAAEPARASRDWSALLEQARHADRQLSPEERDLVRRGILDGTVNGWNVDLLHALQRAIEGRDRAQLLAMLDAGLPVPGFMAPLLADAMRMIVRGGRPTALTAAADAAIRSVFDALVHPDAGMTPAKAAQEIATARGLSVDAIRRSLKRTEP